jgi:hypothetical protein
MFTFLTVRFRTLAPSDPTYLLRRALGDLFLGPYPRHFAGQMPQIIACLRA